MSVAADYAERRGKKRDVCMHRSRLYNKFPAKRPLPKVSVTDIVGPFSDATECRELDSPEDMLWTKTAAAGWAHCCRARHARHAGSSKETPAKSHQVPGLGRGGSINKSKLLTLLHFQLHSKNRGFPGQIEAAFCTHCKVALQQG